VRYLSNFTDKESNYFIVCVKVFLPWKMHLPLESQLVSKPQILLSVFQKYIVVMTESILLHPVYQQEAFMNIFYSGSPWSATLFCNDSQ
jgi:hypothetical protein